MNVCLILLSENVCMCERKDGWGGNGADNR